jgi:hypothetical protein
MTLDKTVLELGQIPYQIFPKMNTVVKVERKQNVINNRYPTNALENEYQGMFDVTCVTFVTYLLTHLNFFFSK